MRVFKTEGGFLIRLERGEEIHESLTAFAAEKGIKGAVVQGIGAVTETELGYYRMDRREYDRRSEPGDTELLSLSGNLCMKDGRPFLHAHVVLMRRDFSLTGGHLFRGTVSATVEISVQQTGLDLVRLPDQEVGLPLLECGPDSSPPGRPEEP